MRLARALMHWSSAQSGTCLRSQLHFTTTFIFFKCFVFEEYVRKHFNSHICLIPPQELDYDKIYKNMLKPAFMFDGRRVLDHLHPHLQSLGFQVRFTKKKKKVPTPPSCKNPKYLSFGFFGLFVFLSAD